MQQRMRVSSGAKWEPIAGYCRAMRVGDRIYVTGTTSLNEKGELVGAGDAYLQTFKAFETSRLLWTSSGASLANVVRTRMFVTDISRWEEIGRAHGEFFREHPPCATMVEVSGLIDPEMLVEIEADAEF